MLVEEVMTTDVVTVPVDATLREVIGRLLGERVGSVVVVDGADNPAGIVTETDALRALYRAETRPAAIEVRELTGRPVVTTSPSKTVQSVARTMAAQEVKKVPVIAGLDLVGIVTLTDIVWELSELRAEAIELGQARTEWESAE